MVVWYLLFVIFISLSGWKKFCFFINLDVILLIVKWIYIFMRNVIIVMEIYGDL